MSILFLCSRKRSSLSETPLTFCGKNLLTAVQTRAKAGNAQCQLRTDRATRLMRCVFSAILIETMRDHSFFRFENSSSLGESLRNFVRLVAGAARALGPPSAFASDDRCNLLHQGS